MDHTNPFKINYVDIKQIETKDVIGAYVQRILCIYTYDWTH